MSRFWNFANETEESVDLSIEGVLQDDENWMEWFYEYGDFVKNTPGGLRNTLAKYKGKTVNVRINSYGGDVFAGVGLYDALIEHKRSGGKVITNGEKVFSAAVMPFLAGDERNMYPGGMLLLHNPLQEIYGNSEDLRAAADELDKVKECILNVYENATGLDRDRLSDFMNDETEMTAQEAVEAGLATGILKTGAIKNVSPVKQMSAIMNAAKICREGVMNAIVLAEKAGKETMMDYSKIKSLKDLREAFPELAKQAESEAQDRVSKAVNAERKRIADLDALGNGNAVIAKIIQNAKETGKTAEDISFYVNAVKESVPDDKKAKTTVLDNMKKDFEDSGAQGVKAVPAQSKEEAVKEAQNVAIIKACEDAFGK